MFLLDICLGGYLDSFQFGCREKIFFISFHEVRKCKPFKVIQCLCPGRWTCGYFFLVLWLWPAHFILVSFLNFANFIFFLNYNFRRDGEFWCPKEGLATNGCNTAFNYYKYSGCSNKCYYLFCHSVGAILNYWHVNNSQAAHIH